MSSEYADQEMLKNLDLLIAMDVLEKESDWAALEVEGLSEIPENSFDDVVRAKELNDETESQKTEEK